MECSFEGCDFITHTLELIMKHLLRNHQVKLVPRLPCPYCDIGKQSLVRLESHVSTVHKATRPFQCTACGNKPFHFLWEGHHHWKRYHVEVSCKQCGSRHDSRVTLQKHMESEHPDLSPDEVSSSEEEESGPQECDICGKVIGNMGSYKSHMLAHARKPLGERIPACLLYTSPSPRD